MSIPSIIKPFLVSEFAINRMCATGKG
jgi:hypothetical protein